MTERKQQRYRSVKFNVVGLRAQLAMNQTDFWSKLGISQSGGSRTENSGYVSLPVMKLIRLQYLEGIDVDKTSREAGIVESEHWRRT